MKKILLHLGLLLAAQFFYTDLSAATSKIESPENLTLIEDVAVFNPPAGWMIADRSKVALPPLVKVMVVGKPIGTFPPSMNLTSAPYQGTLKQYLQIVKTRNLQSNNEWKDLGVIRTQAGNSSLSQIDSKSQWGDIRQMHVIHLKNGIIYVLTAAALKTEFSLYYQDFFNAMRSFRISNDLLGIISNPGQKNELQNEIKNIKERWKAHVSQNLQNNSSLTSEQRQEIIFDSEPFKSKTWDPFKSFLQKNFTDFGPEWQASILQNVKNELFDIKNEKSNCKQSKN